MTDTSQHRPATAAGDGTPMGWTRIWWPAMLAVCVAAFITGTFLGFAGWALTAGIILIGGPEVWFLAHHQWADTLSDWWWRTFHIHGTPIRRWSALEALGLGSYLAVTVAADRYLAHFGYWPCAAGCVVTFWLGPHLFRRWWR